MADSNDKNNSNNFDDFGFSEDEEESSQLEGAKAIDERLLHEVDQPPKKSNANNRSSGVDVDAKLSWLQQNKIAVGGGLLALVILFVFFGHGKKRVAVQAPEPVVATPSVAPEAPVIAEKTTQQMVVPHESTSSVSQPVPASVSDVPQKVANTQESVANVTEQQTSAASMQVTEAMNDINRRLESLEATLQEVKNTQQSINNLSTELKSNQQSAAANGESIKRIEFGMSTLNNTLQTMQKVLFRQALFEQAMKPGGAKQADYIVQATIPGRAWLRNLDGILITVREGQEIPGFGKVAKIDPLKGTVTMSNQTIFKEE